VILEVWLSGSEPSIIVQQLSVRKDPRSLLRGLTEDEIIIIIIMNEEIHTVAVTDLVPIILS